MRIALNSLLESKCPNVWHDILTAGKLTGATVEVPNAEAARILAHCADSIPVIIDPAQRADQWADQPIGPAQPVPLSGWPLPLQLLAKLAKPTDAGLGDVIERVVGPIGGNAFKLWFRRATGRDCGCGQRKQKLNELYPLLKPERCFAHTAGH